MTEVTPRIAVGAGCDPRLLAGLGPYVRWVTPGGGALDGYVCASPAEHARVVAAYPGLAVEVGGRLGDPAVRGRFAERVFARARVAGLFAAAWRPRDLVAFHARHKLQLLAHDPERYRASGRIVAGCAGRTRGGVGAEYLSVVTAALARPATPGRTANALQHAFGLVSAHLTAARRARTAAAIEAYRTGAVPLHVPIGRLRDHAAALNAGYLAAQTLLTPYPDAVTPR